MTNPQDSRPVEGQAAPPPVVRALTTTAKMLILVGSITVLPFWLALYQDVPPLYAVGGSFALCVFLTVLWTQR